MGILGLCAGALVGCGGEDSPPEADGAESGGNGGAASSGGSGGAGGSHTGSGGGSNTGGTGTGGVRDSTPSLTGPAIRAAGGVLTSLASATFTKTSGNLAITTFHAFMDEVDAVHLWGDIENRGSATECFPLATLSIDGHAIGVVVRGPIHETGAGLDAACLPPGGTGVISGIDLEAASNLLDGPNIVSYSFRTQPDAKAIPKHLPTLTDVSVTESDFGYTLTGNVVERYLPVHDVSLRFFIRDSSGLLRDSQYVSVNDGGTILPAVPVPFEIDFIPDPFSQYVYFIDLEEGMKPDAAGAQSNR